MKAGERSPADHDQNAGEWGSLPLEPCRFCREVGGVFFLLDEGPEGRCGHEVVRCDRCRRSWLAGSSNA